MHGVDWIDHNGHFPPRHVGVTDLVNVRFRDDEETKRPEQVRYWVHNWTWDRRHPSPSEIVAYQVVR